MDVAKLHLIKNAWDEVRYARKSQLTRPFITICLAQSLDGCISVCRSGQTRLSGKESSVLTHCLRAWHDAILVGANTVRVDDPRLTVREVLGRQPQRVVLDSRLRIAESSQMLRDAHAKPWIFTSLAADKERQSGLAKKGCRIIPVPSEHELLSLPACLTVLKRLEIGSVMVEGGARILASFLNQRLVDFLIVTIVPAMIRTKTALMMHGLENTGIPFIQSPESMCLGNDVIVYGPLAFSQLEPLAELAPERRSGLFDYSWERLNANLSKPMV